MHPVFTHSTSRCKSLKLFIPPTPVLMKESNFFLWPCEHPLKIGRANSYLPDLQDRKKDGIFRLLSRRKTFIQQQKAVPLSCSNFFRVWRSGSAPHGGEPYSSLYAKSLDRRKKFSRGWAFKAGSFQRAHALLLIQGRADHSTFIAFQSYSDLARLEYETKVILKYARSFFPTYPNRTFDSLVERKADSLGGISRGKKEKTDWLWLWLLI